MTDKALTSQEWRDANFREALRRLPPPVPMYDNGVVCPWCGALHTTVTFGGNSCIECSRPFVFGEPPWGKSEADGRLMSWVPFPFLEWEAMGQKATLLAEWKPNDRLRDIYKFWRDREKSDEIDKQATHRVDPTVQ